MFRDFREVLARQDIDAVMISTPDHWHVPMAMAAAQAGKDVSCEKPLTRSIAEGRVLSDAVSGTTGSSAPTASSARIASFQRACELVRNGRIGKLHTIRTGVPVDDVAGPLEPRCPCRRNSTTTCGSARPRRPVHRNRVHPRHSYDRPGWMRIRDYCDGMVTNWGAHLNDIAQWGNGTDRTGPVEVEGTGKYPRDGLWDVLLDSRSSTGMPTAWSCSTTRAGPTSASRAARLGRGRVR